ncbi:MAG: efflux RND transporter periplasmic adaptor subunit, partial [Kiritimatiellaeota bacterium]|nr:efflux RND transporter periplasmic adaptor subunit [Kiritimatiellota bacterium]
PEGAVQFGKQGSYLYVITDKSAADMRVVQLGVRVGDLVQVVSGVKAGENVVVLGQLMLFPGAPVMDASKPPPAAPPAAAKETEAKK